MVSKGAAALAKECEQHTQAGVARRLGTYQSVVSRWLSGEPKPGAEFRFKIEDEFDISPRLWDELVEPAPEEPVPDTEPAPAQGAT